jgi:hypothetical protein
LSKTKKTSKGKPKPKTNQPKHLQNLENSKMSTKCKGRKKSNIFEKIKQKSNGGIKNQYN